MVNYESIDCRESKWMLSSSSWHSSMLVPSHQDIKTTSLRWMFYLYIWKTKIDVKKHEKRCYAIKRVVACVMRLTERCTLSSLYFDRVAGAWYDMHFCGACVQICDAHGVKFVQAQPPQASMTLKNLITYMLWIWILISNFRDKLLIDLATNDSNKMWQNKENNPYTFVIFRNIKEK